MTEIVNEYDAKIDSKKRLTLRNCLFDYFHVKEREDGSILLEPRVLVRPKDVSKETLKMMDRSITNFKANKVSEPIDLKEFKKK